MWSLFQNGYIAGSLRIYTGAHHFHTCDAAGKYTCKNRALKKGGYLQSSILIRKRTFQFRKLGICFMSSSWKHTSMMEKICFIYNQTNRTITRV